MIKQLTKFAYVIACLDPKIRDALSVIFNKRLGKGNYFMPGELGGVKDLLSPEKKTDRERLLRKMKTAAKVHPFDLIILINHSDCGAYRLAGHTFDDPQEECFHRGELQKALVMLKKEFPTASIETHYFLKKEQQLL